MSLDAIPAELTTRNQSVAWRPERRGDKTTKIPINPATGAKASTTDAETWGSHAEAVERAREIEGGGVGFVFSEADPYTGIDLDDCRNPETGSIAVWAWKLTERLNSYAETSPSGTGIHIFVRAMLPPGGRRKGDVEMYDRERFFTLTGNHIAGTPTTIEPRQDALDALHAALFPTKPSRTAPAPSTRADASDEDLLRKAMYAKNGAKFTALWNGDVGGYDSHSDADLALCSLLAFWCGPDAGRIDRVFRQSGLMREKWERDDYRERTLTVAMERADYYSGRSGAKPPLTIVPVDTHENAPTFNFTDVGNGQRLVAMFGENLRYSHLMGRWFHWDGARWAMDDQGRIEAFAKAVAKRIYAEGGDERLDAKERAALAKHAIRSEARERIKAMVDMAKTEKGVAIEADDLDAHPHLLTVENGTIDLRRGELLAHRREDYLTKMIPVPYDPNTTCPRWLAFLDQIMAGDADKIAFIRRAIGYSLTASTDERVLFIPWGNGANGKSTLLETMQMLMGDLASRTATQTLMVRRYEGVPNDVAALRGRRFVFTSESEEGERLAEARIKDLTGGDRQTARFMRAEWFEFTPTFKIWLATNHKPEIRGTDQAIWDRIRLIPFTVTIPEGERVPKGQLLAAFRAELPGILAWAVAGAKEWYAHGLGTPESVRQATREYRDEMDVLGQWLTDCCYVGPTAVGTVAALYGSYQAWCEETGVRSPLSQRAWGNRLGERGFQRDRGGHGGKRGWIGLGLLDPPPSDRVTDGDRSALSVTMPFPLTQQGERGVLQSRVTDGDSISDITLGGNATAGYMSNLLSPSVTMPVVHTYEANDSKENGMVTDRTRRDAICHHPLDVAKSSPPAGVLPAHRYKWRQVHDYSLGAMREDGAEIVEWNVEDTAKAIGFPVVAGEMAQDFAERFLRWDGNAEDGWE
jgi:putative DNA primase/helicase